ncbi:hypothetical protein FRC00_008741 [Tulasnella sp. 408]|nr:hypothetical protein FRC00_008741 [Tulasnella sp. 408]
MQSSEEKRTCKEEKRLRKEEEKKLPKEERKALKEARHLEREEKRRRKAEKRQRSPSPIPLDDDAGNAPVLSEDQVPGEPERKKAKVYAGGVEAQQGAPSVTGDKRKHAVAERDAQPAPTEVSGASPVIPGPQDAKRRRLEAQITAPSMMSAKPPPPVAAVPPTHSRVPPPDPTRAPPYGQNTDTPNTTAQLPQSDTSPTHPTEPVESSDPLEPHGSPILLSAPLQGYFATRYYPHRESPLQVPTGKLTAEATAERYRGLNDDQIKERQESYARESVNHSKVFQDAFKHTARGRLDKHAHLWLIPRLHNYYDTKSRDARSALLDRIIRDLIHEFPDLHPNFFKLRDTSMEKDYLNALRNVVFVAISGIKPALQNPSKVENIDKEIVKQLSGAGAPRRPHDLWARDQQEKAKAEQSKAAQSGEKKPSNGESNLDSEWHTVFEEAKVALGVETATKHRLELEQKFRKQKFELLSEAEKTIYNDMAADPKKPIDPTAALISGLPYLNLVVKRFTDLAEVPMVILMGARDPSNPERILVFQDSYTPAPSDVPDFLNGPDQLGQKVIVPAFRKYLAKCFGAQPDHVASAGIPLPTASVEDAGEPLVEDQGPEPNLSSEERPDAVKSRPSIQFTVTPAPKDWATPSKELEVIKKNLKVAIRDSFKKFHGKQHCRFTVLGTKSEQYINSSFLPTTRIVPVLLPDGRTVFKEGEHDLIVYPTDPEGMHWYQVKAYFDLLKDPKCRFQWLVEEQAKTVDLDELPPIPAKTSHPSRSTSAQDSEPEAETSAHSTDSSPFSVGSESSLAQAYQDHTEYILRPETISRSGRRSAPGPSLSALPAPSNHSTGIGGVSDEQSEGNSPPNHPHDATHPAPGAQLPTIPVSFNAVVSRNDAPGQFDSSVERVRELSLPTTFQQNGPLLPNLSTLLKHCARLDKLFPARSPSPLALPGTDVDNTHSSLALFWENLNDPQKPVPTFLEATQLASRSGVTIQTVVKGVDEFLVAFLDILEGHDLAESTMPGAPSFVSWTDYLLIMARYLKFAESIEPGEGIVPAEDFCMLHERTLELAIIHLTVRYCSGAIIGHISNHPAPSSQPSIANVISTLGTAWMELLKRTCRSLNKTVLSEVMGPNWAFQVDPSGQLPQRNPFFHLAIPSKRWFTVIATPTLYDAIEKLEVRLHNEPTLVEVMSVYEQFTLVAAICAVHDHEDIRGTDENWLSIIDHFLQVIESSGGGVTAYEIERAPLPPPPTLVPTGPKSYTRPRLSTRRAKSAWAVGDVAVVDINGEKEEVIFVRKQKYGSALGYLVMARQDPIREIIAPDGESELPLPAFDETILVKHGPTNPVELTHLRVSGLNLGRNLGIGDMLKPEYAGYLAQFRDVPDDVDPNVMEQRGFKPPEYFAKLYFDSLAKQPAENVILDHNMPSHTSESRNAIQMSDARPPTPNSRDPPLPAANPSSRDFEDAQSGTVEGFAPETRSSENPYLGRDLSSVVEGLGSDAAEGQRWGNGDVEREGQQAAESDEEEVENVLIEGKIGSNSKGKAKPRRANLAPKVQKPKVTPAKGGAVRKKPTSSTPAARTESGRLTRANTRNQAVESSAAEDPAPAQTSRRVSARLSEKK